ncbi:MAG: hypothetical protein ACRDJN_12990, partial [Chloroflexota bacterium]
AMAVKAVLQASNSQGYYGWDEQGRSCSYTARRDGIVVEAPDGSVGWLTWLDVVRAARAPAQQLSLFDLEGIG